MGVEGTRRGGVTALPGNVLHRNGAEINFVFLSSVLTFVISPTLNSQLVKQ